MIAESLLWILCGLTGASLIGGLLLWATVQLYNLVVSELAVPKMLFGKAFEVLFVVCLIAFVLHEFIQALATRQARALWELSLVPVSLLSLALVLWLRLPTSLGRAALLTFCYASLTTVVAVIVVPVVIAAVLLWRIAVE
jgi:hypothetical protein